MSNALEFLKKLRASLQSAVNADEVANQEAASEGITRDEYDQEIMENAVTCGNSSDTYDSGFSAGELSSELAIAKKIDAFLATHTLPEVPDGM